MNNVKTMTAKIEDKVIDTGAKALFHSTKVMGKIFSKKYVMAILSTMLVVSMFTVTAFADGADAEGFISEIVGLLQTWIPRLGGMIVVVGGIQLGIGFKDDNADGKTRGMQCMIGGAIVAAIGALVSF